MFGCDPLRDSVWPKNGCVDTETSHLWVRIPTAHVSAEPRPTPLAAVGHVVCSCEQHGESPDGVGPPSPMDSPHFSWFFRQTHTALLVTKTFGVKERDNPCRACSCHSGCSVRNWFRGKEGPAAALRWQNDGAGRKLTRGWYFLLIPQLEMGQILVPRLPSTKFWGWLVGIGPYLTLASQWVSCSLMAPAAPQAQPWHPVNASRLRMPLDEPSTFGER